MANGDGALFLVKEIFRPWEAILDAVFYLGASYGTYKISRALLSAVKGVHTYLVPVGRAMSNSTDLSQRFGSWAVVTGVRSSLGRAFAHELARRRLNIVLVSQNHQEMEELLQELVEQHGVSVKSVSVDITRGQDMFTDLHRTLEEDQMEVGVLVTCNPVRYTHPQYHGLVPPLRLWELIIGNITATTMITNELVPAMVRRGKGVIINVSSFFGSAPPTPLLGGYTATMSYITNFTRTLHKECSKNGVIAQALVPWMITRDEESSSLFSPSASTYVKHALATVGVSHYCCGYWPHALQCWLFSLLPDSVWTCFWRLANTRRRKECLTRAVIEEDPHLFQRVRIYSGPNEEDTKLFQQIRARNTPELLQPHQRLLRTSSSPSSVATPIGSTPHTGVVAGDDNQDLSQGSSEEIS